MIPFYRGWKWKERKKFCLMSHRKSPSESHLLALRPKLPHPILMPTRSNFDLTYFFLCCQGSFTFQTEYLFLNRSLWIPVTHAALNITITKTSICSLVQLLFFSFQPLHGLDGFCKPSLVPVHLKHWHSNSYTWQRIWIFTSETYSS